MGSNADDFARQLDTVPIGNNNPHDNPNQEKNKDEHKDAVGQREEFLAGVRQSAGDEPVHVEEGRDEHKEREETIYNLFGIILENPEEQ